MNPSSLNRQSLVDHAEEEVCRACLAITMPRGIFWTTHISGLHPGEFKPTGTEKSPGIFTFESLPATSEAQMWKPRPERSESSLQQHTARYRWCWGWIQKFNCSCCHPVYAVSPQ